MGGSGGGRGSAAGVAADSEGALEDVAAVSRQSARQCACVEGRSRGAAVQCHTVCRLAALACRRHSHLSSSVSPPAPLPAAIASPLKTPPGAHLRGTPSAWRPLWGPSWARRWACWRRRAAGQRRRGAAPAPPGAPCACWQRPRGWACPWPLLRPAGASPRPAGVCVSGVRSKGAHQGVRSEGTVGDRAGCSCAGNGKRGVQGRAGGWRSVRVRSHRRGPILARLKHIPEAAPLLPLAITATTAAAPCRGCRWCGAAGSEGVGCHARGVGPLHIGRRGKGGVCVEKGPGAGAHVDQGHAACGRAKCVRS